MDFVDVGVYGIFTLTIIGIIIKIYQSFFTKDGGKTNGPQLTPTSSADAGSTSGTEGNCIGNAPNPKPVRQTRSKKSAKAVK